MKLIFIHRKGGLDWVLRRESTAKRHEGKIKGNENIFYVVDNIYSAINNDQQITFKYYEWVPDGTRRLKHDGADYLVSPWALVWDSEKYYLVAYDEKEKAIRHYR